MDNLFEIFIATKDMFYEIFNSVVSCVWRAPLDAYAFEGTVTTK